MRGVETRIQEIRHRIFREVARMAYHTEWPVDKRIGAVSDGAGGCGLFANEWSEYLVKHLPKDTCLQEIRHLPDLR